MKQICGTCRFFHAYSGKYEFDGQCNLKPQTVDVPTKNYWCGQWRESLDCDNCGAHIREKEIGNSTWDTPLEGPPKYFCSEACQDSDEAKDKK